MKEEEKIPRRMLQTNTAEMLSIADKQIKCISYQLQTVVSDGNFHTVIHPNFENKIEVIEGQYIYCKIPADKCFSPCSVKIRKENTNTDLKAYISFSNHMPSKENHFKQFKNPRFFKLYAIDQTNPEKKGNLRQFDSLTKFIYVSFFSVTGASLDVKVKFTTQEEALGKKKIDAQAEKRGSKKDAINAEVDRQYRKEEGTYDEDECIPGERELMMKFEKERALVNYDFVKDNVENVGIYPSEKIHKRQARLRTADKRQRIAR